MRYAILLVALLVVACQTVPGTGPTPGPDPIDISGLESFDSVEQYQQFMQQFQGTSGMGDTRFMMMDVAMAESAPMAADGAAVKQAGNDYSETNNQVAGIDEADIMKNDGEYIYTITQQTLYIVKAYPGEDAEVVSTVELPGHGTGLFIEDDRLMVIGRLQEWDDFDFVPQNGMTYVHMYDVSDHEDPNRVKEFVFEGNYFEGRMSDGNAYVLTQHSPIFRGPMPLPIIMEDGVSRTMPVEDMRILPFPYENPSHVNIHVIDMQTSDSESTSIIAEGGRTLYMSANNIYLAHTKHINEWEIRQDILHDLIEPRITAQDQERIQKIREADSAVLTQYEKERKIDQIYNQYLNYMKQDERDDLEEEADELLEEEMEQYEHLEYTILHRIPYDGFDIGSPETGEVPGSVNNQFSMDEHDDVLRVATTLNGRWSSFDKERTESTNNVYALDDDMDVIGSLEGLAPTERIFSTRYVGERLYMVTFRQVDPFFVIDLSDPTDIQELGQLKIPGFSRYLHPYDENTIIGLGQDATEQGRTRGLKVALYDVSDVSEPEEIAVYTTDKYASSNAMWEHKAFLFDKEKELLVIPAYKWGDDGYNGAFVFRVEPDEIELRGLIDHSQGNRYGPQVERSAYIEELLYTKSPGLLRINELDDLSSVKSIQLKQEVKDIVVY